MKESRFPKVVLNYNPRGKREIGRSGEAGKIFEAGTDNNS